MNEEKKKRPFSDWLFAILCLVVVILFICQKLFWDK